MNKTKNAAESRLNPVEVAQWLQERPFFLGDFPDLAQKLLIPRENGAAASLASYQLDIVREKNRELNRRLQELSANAQSNELLAVRIHQFTLKIMAQNSITAVLDTLEQVLINEFSINTLRLILFTPLINSENYSWIKIFAADHPALQAFSDSLYNKTPLCGRLRTDKHEILYDQTPNIYSSALLPLPGMGLLAMGSHESNRFYPGMGTLFLTMMADALAAALSRYSPHNRVFNESVATIKPLETLKQPIQQIQTHHLEPVVKT